jgi:uncharacterized hydrophobic protein (TIGR00271 family)
MKRPIGSGRKSGTLIFEKYRMKLPRLFRSLSKERRSDVLDELEKDSSPGFDYFLLVTLSCSIATFGLITNSVAVIIGAMLVAPLMSPILGLSLASLAGEQGMFRKAVIALVEGSLLAIALSALLGLLANALPFDVFKELPSEILARTHPTPFDLGIGLAGGAAAAYALAQPRLSAALPGVAIATALMPPLCTVGIGVALGNNSVTFGALLLFLTNLTAISFAGIVVFAALGFRPRHVENTWHHIPKSLFISAGLTLLITIPLIILTLQVVNQARLNQGIRQAITTELSGLPDAQLVSVNIDTRNSTLQLLVTIRTSRQPDYDQVVALQSAVAVRLQRTITLQLIVVPTTRLDPLVPPTPTGTPTPSRTPMPSPSVTFTVTNTYTPTSTLTPTPTFTPTPILAFIANTGGRGVYLRDAPGGRIIGSLSEGAPVDLLYQRVTVNGSDWIEVQFEIGRTGWVQAFYLIIKP